LNTVHGGTTETLAVVFQASIFVVVTYSCQILYPKQQEAHTLAEGNTDLDSHVLSRESGSVKQALRAARVGETSGIDEGLEWGGAGRFSWLSITDNQLTGSSTSKESGSC
jgi:hypothetical protein